MLAVHQLRMDSDSPDVNKEVLWERHDSHQLQSHPLPSIIPCVFIKNRGSGVGGYLLQSTNETTLPTGPPTLRRALAALEMAGPAAAEALERPSEALEAAEEALWLALLAASEVDEECLTTVLRVRNCDCRRTARVAAGILGTAGEEEGAKMKIRSQVTRCNRWCEDEGVQWRFSYGATTEPESADSRFGNFREMVT